MSSAFSWGRLTAFLVACSLASAAVEAAPLRSKVLSDVSVSPAFFNPTLGQKATIHLKAARRGTLVAKILDRDRFPIRTLDSLAVVAGPVIVVWDGRDQAGEVVPDEAYNLRLEFTDGKTADAWDPSDHFRPKQQDAKINFYSREDGVLSYTLPWAARVHAQAGQFHAASAAGTSAGPILKTLVDDGPRVAGAVIEKWNGLDEGGTINVPDLPDFVVAVLATELPAGSMITVGNRKQTFFSYARARRGSEAIKPRTLSAEAPPHHLSLSALEDQTPALALKPKATWVSAKRSWDATVPLNIDISVLGDGAPYFLSQPTTLEVFIDGRRVLRREGPGGAPTVELRSDDLPPGAHRVVVNWSSALGPVAVNAIQVNVRGSDDPQARNVQ